MMVLVDSNVIIDLLVDDPDWKQWSAEAVRQAIRTGGAAINPIVFAEITPHFDSHAVAAQWLDLNAYAPLDLPYEAAFAAGQAFAKYKAHKGTKLSPLPDFYIGAHALVRGMPLLTRDVRRYRTYFPDLQLITPPSA